VDHIFCICQILEKKWEYNGVLHQLFIEFKKAYGSVRRKVLYSVLIEFGISLKLVSFRVCHWKGLGKPRGLEIK
jgi:hypothetical protein